MTVFKGKDLRFEELPGRRSADPLEGVTASSSLRVVELVRTAGRTAHRHPHSEELVYVASGRGKVWIDGVRLPVGIGDIVRIPPGAAHATIPDDDRTKRLMCFFTYPELAANLDDTDIGASGKDANE